jgi:hypothetical protein
VNGQSARGREQLVSIECAHCGEKVTYSGTGRRPRYCSASCRSRAWELRQAAARLERENPMPAVVREVVERTVDRDRPVPAAPRRAAEWVRLLQQLEHQVRDNPLVLVRSGEEFQELAAAVRGLYNAFTWRTPEPDPAVLPPPHQPDEATGLSRQQRRARERAQRKRH